VEAARLRRRAPAPPPVGVGHDQTGEPDLKDAEEQVVSPGLTDEVADTDEDVEDATPRLSQRTRGKGATAETTIIRAGMVTTTAAMRSEPWLTSNGPMLPALISASSPGRKKESRSA
jgi:hypothetical protein